MSIIQTKSVCYITACCEMVTSPDRRASAVGTSQSEVVRERRGRQTLIDLPTPRLITVKLHLELDGCTSWTSDQIFSEPKFSLKSRIFCNYYKKLVEVACAEHDLQSVGGLAVITC